MLIRRLLIKIIELVDFYNKATYGYLMVLLTRLIQLFIKWVVFNIKTKHIIHFLAKVVC